MLEFLRRYQQNIMLVVAVVVIISFAWFFAPFDARRGSLTGADAFSVGNTAVSPDEIKRQGTVFDSMRGLAGGLGGSNNLINLVGPGGIVVDRFQNFHLTERGKLTLTQNRLIIRDAARKLGVEVSETEVEDAIKKNTVFHKAGKFDAETYEDTIRNTWNPQGLQAGDMRAAIVDSLLVEKVENLLGSNLRAAPSQVEVEFQRQNEKVTVALAEMKREEFEKDITITDEQIKNTYEQRVKAPKPAASDAVKMKEKESVLSKEKRQIEFVFFQQPEEPAEARRKAEAAKAAAPPPAEATTPAAPPPAEATPPAPPSSENAEGKPKTEEKPKAEDKPKAEEKPKDGKEKAGSGKKEGNKPWVDDESEPPGQAPPAPPAAPETPSATPPTPPTDPAPPVPADLAPPPVPPTGLEPSPLTINPVPGAPAEAPAGLPALGGLGGAPQINLGSQPPAQPTPEETAQKAKDAEEHKKNMEAFALKVDQFYTEAQKAPEKLKDLAAKENPPLEVKTTPVFAQSEPPADMNLPAELISALFAHHGDEKEKSLLPAVEVTSGSAKGYYVARIIKTEPVRDLTLDEAKPKLTEELKEEEADKKFEAAATEKRTKLEEALKAGKNFEEAARELGLVARTLAPFKATEVPQAEASRAEISQGVAETVTGTISKLQKATDRKSGILVYVQEREEASNAKPPAAPTAGAAPADPEETKKQIEQDLESGGRYYAFHLWLEEQRRHANIKENQAYVEAIARDR